jgi:hypothetical protein
MLDAFSQLAHPDLVHREHLAERKQDFWARSAQAREPQGVQLSSASFQPAPEWAAFGDASSRGMATAAAGALAHMPASVPLGAVHKPRPQVRIGVSDAYRYRGIAYTRICVSRIGIAYTRICVSRIGIAVSRIAYRIGVSDASDLGLGWA